MTRILFFLLTFSIIAAKATAQLSSNKYYEVLDSCNNTTRTIYPLEDGRFLSYPKKEHGLVYLLDKNRDKIELPCNKIEWTRPIKTNCFKCIKDGKGALFSLESNQVVSPFYDSLSVINSNFYMVWKKDSLHIFNSQNEMLFQTAIDTSKRESKHLFRHCNDDQLICKINEEEFYLNTKGDLSKDGICNSELSLDYYPDGTYLFKQDKKWGLKSKDGSILIKANYKRLHQWQGGKYIVAVQEEKHGKYLYGVIDQNENILLSVEYDAIKDYEFGLSVKKKGCKNVFLDTDLKNKYDEEFDQLRVAKCGLIRGKTGTQKFYDLIFTKNTEGTTGKIVSAKSITDERCQVVYENGLSVIYDKSGNTVFSYEGKVSASKVYEDILQIKLNPKKVGLINATGQWIVEPGNFSFKSTKFNDGIYKVNLDSRQSDLLNSKGELVYPNVKNGGIIPTKGNYIISNGQGKAVVSPEGKLLIPFGKYRIHEFTSSIPKYYRLTLGNVDYVVQLK